MLLGPLQIAHELCSGAFKDIHFLKILPHTSAHFSEVYYSLIFRRDIGGSMPLKKN
jgi:hypothetical protein